MSDRKLKIWLVFLSFCPLFILLFIAHVGYSRDMLILFNDLIQKKCTILEMISFNRYFWDFLITIICIFWFILTAFAAIGFTNIQKTCFDSYGEKIAIVQEDKNSGLNFFVTFIIPLLVDDISSLRGFCFFLVLIFMVFYLFMKSGLFYQTPVLFVLNFRTYKFTFENPANDVEVGKEYIGLTNESISEERVIERRRIDDGVFLIYNKH